MPPKTIAGRYHVEREVGRGASGSVWLCRDERLGRDVAVKQLGHLPGGLVPDLARALREARSTAGLNHRNVVAVYDAIEEGDHIWLVMEYVPGRTLSQVVADEGALPPERAAWIGAQVADGLAAAHERGTIHRDVKPGNILVSADDQAKISDFGISRTLGEETLTESGMMTGTPAYFSPELARGAEPSTASDVWALGASLYLAVEGRAPFPEKPTALALLGTIASERPPRPVSAGVLEEAISRMMDPDPGSRWEMKDCAHALHRLADRHGGATTRAHTAGFAATAAAVHPAPTPAPETTTATPAAAPTPARPRRRRTPLVLLALAALLLGGIAWLAFGYDGEEPGQATPSAADSSQPADEPTKKPTSSPTEEETTSAPAPDPTSAEPAKTSGGRAGFVEGYYGVLPDDTDAGWSMLSEGYQDQTGSFEDYDGFWSTIDSVSVEDTSPAGPDAVDVTLTYVTDGESETETRRIYVERSGDGYLISGDEVVDG